ncbi:ras GEF [Backusella circina FSU 941]|nr:ras GEF [Backusella circina FSU 941]
MTYKRLPLIPLSPLVQSSIQCAKILAQTTLHYSNMSQSDTKDGVFKELNKERAKLDVLTKSMQKIQDSSLLDLNVYEIAKEIALIDYSLLHLVSLDKKLLSQFDKRSNIIPIVDFHRYLVHAIAHQLIYESNQQRKKKCMVAQLIQVCFILLHIYRDFSGLTAILTCLNLPEVQRLENLWTPCPQKAQNTLKELSTILSPKNQYETYRKTLRLHLDTFLNSTPTKSQMIAVPFMHAHLSAIQNIVHTHSVATGKDGEVLLSEAGQQPLEIQLQVLEFCQQYSYVDRADLDKCLGPVLKKRLSLQSSATVSPSASFFKLTCTPVLDAEKLLVNQGIYHWIVSRAYLSRSQLYLESLEVAPLGVGEISIEPEEEYDFYWDFYTPEKSNGKQRMEADVNELVVTAPDPSSSNVPQTSYANLSGENSTMEDRVNEPSEIIDQALANKDEDKNESENNNKGEGSHPSLIGDKDTNASEDNGVDENEDDGVEREIIIAEDDEQSPSEFDKQQSEARLKAALSPTAPEFIPQKYAANNTDNPSKNEEDEEVWKGYPVKEGEGNEEEEEEEKWTGYPANTANLEDEDEEEIWKGYPIPQQASPDTIDLSTPSTPQEELDEADEESWKGYQGSKAIFPSWDQKKQQYAIGKAEARRMQYSLSTTDNRKRMPDFNFSTSSST